MNTEVMFSSKSDEWSTPQDIYEQLDNEFHFNLDPCATEENHKCDTFFTQNDDGLSKNWGGTGPLLIHHIHRLSNGLRSLGKKALSLILLW